MFFVVPKALGPRIRKALAALEGYPARGVVVGGPDFISNVPGSPGWTTDAVDEGDEDGDTVCIELPQRLEKHLGKTVKVGSVSVKLPTLDALAADEDGLPATLKAIRQARRDAGLLKQQGN